MDTVSIPGDEKVLEVGCGCTTLQMYLMPLHFTILNGTFYIPHFYNKKAIMLPDRYPRSIDLVGLGVTQRPFQAPRVPAPWEAGTGVSGREAEMCPGSHRSALPSSAGCFFGNEVRGSAESCGPGDTDASWEVPGPASSPARLHGKESKKGPSHATANLPAATDLSSLTFLPLGLEEPESADCHALWAWVSGGGCAVEAHTTLKWFTTQSGKCGCPAPQRGPRRIWNKRGAPTMPNPSFWSLPRRVGLSEGRASAWPLPSCPSRGGHPGLTWGDACFPTRVNDGREGSRDISQRC